jgi:hypothetical protein
MDDSNSICEALDLNESEDQLPSKEFLDLFEKLDTAISGELIEKAWKQYDTISQQILLEVKMFFSFKKIFLYFNF